MKRIICALTLGVGSSIAVADSGFNQDSFYAGAGLSLNSLSGYDDAMGYQVFAGYDLDFLNLGAVRLAVEVGYMNSGDFEFEETFFGQTFTFKTDASGLWATGVVSYPLSDRFDLVGRLGLDFGDDDGFMLGGGAGYRVADQWGVRAEYVMRDNIDSLQLNAAFRF